MAETSSSETKSNLNAHTGNTHFESAARMLTQEEVDERIRQNKNYISALTKKL